MDSLTRKIITILRHNGRASYADIARELSTTRANVAARVNPLFQSGELRVVAAPHPRVLGLRVSAHLSIKIKGDPRIVLQKLEVLDSLSLITTVVGAYQVVADTDVRDMDELGQQVAMIRAMQQVTDVQVLIYHRVLSSFFPGPAPNPDSVAFDEYDVAIIKRLQQDGRAGYADLAENAGLSVSGSRTRLQRLLESGLVQIGAIPQRGDMTDDLVFGIGVNVDGNVDRLQRLFMAQPGVEFIASTLGRLDLVSTVSFTSLRDFNKLIESIVKLPEVSYCEQWLHSRLLRERYERAVDSISASVGELRR
ncbi:MAG: Lrp/AsnC family transcriptional regulator [Proteobacteria bacterium]|nr:Lrp/AsnC family transcriptional regulator [Pseudomonadota bacterium]